MRSDLVLMCLALPAAWLVYSGHVGSLLGHLRTSSSEHNISLASSHRRILSNAPDEVDPTTTGAPASLQLRHTDNISLLRHLQQQVPGEEIQSHNQHHRHHEEAIVQHEHTDATSMPQQYASADGASNPEEHKPPTVAEETGPGQSEATLDLKIYIYELNSSYTECASDTLCDGYDLYSLDQILPKLVASSPYITKNPEEADYFLVPALMYHGQNKDLEGLVEEVLRKQWPFWDRHNGSDHLLVVPSDFQRCDVTHGFHYKDLIVIGHYGRVANVADNICRVLEPGEWGDVCDEALRMAETPREEWRQCHIPRHDIVVPPAEFESVHNTAPLWVNKELQRQAGSERSTTFFFAGALPELQQEGGWGHRSTSQGDSPTHQAAYSFGVRQTTARLFQHRQGYEIHPGGIDDYQLHLARSKFCLAPAGWGWGGRFKTAVMGGCVPVIVQDGIRVEWEETLDLSQYALRLGLSYLHRLPELLEAYEEKGRLQEAQKAMQCAWRLHFWRRPHGRALELLMCELYARKSGQKVRLDVDNCELVCGGTHSQSIELLPAGSDWGSSAEHQGQQL